MSDTISAYAAVVSVVIAVAALGVSVYYAKKAGSLQERLGNIEEARRQEEIARNEEAKKRAEFEVTAAPSEDGRSYTVSFQKVGVSTAWDVRYSFRWYEQAL